jgi:hypothetical protein
LAQGCNGRPEQGCARCFQICQSVPLGCCQAMRCCTMYIMKDMCCMCMLS